MFETRINFINLTRKKEEGENEQENMKFDTDVVLDQMQDAGIRKQKLFDQIKEATKEI